MGAIFLAVILTAMPATVVLAADVKARKGPISTELARDVMDRMGLR